VSITPLGDRIVVRLDEPEKETSFGIVIPETAGDKPQEGTVVAVGPGRTLDDGSRENLDVAVGDRVLIAKHSGAEYENGHVLLSQREVLGVLARA
jgi:chaperonin GroES